MNRLAFALVCVAASAGLRAQSVVYDNTRNSLNDYFMFVPAWMKDSMEAGDEVWLSGKARRITEMSLIFTFVGTSPGTFDLRIRFRSIAPNQPPGKVIFDSGVIKSQPIRNGTNRYVFPIPKVKVPDHFVWTIQIYNRKGAQGEFGPAYYDPPTVGRSQDSFWQSFDGKEWGQYSWGAAPVANFAARFVAVP